MPQPNPLPRQSATPEWLEGLGRRVGALMWEAEETYGENAAGVYPTEVEMTLRIAWLAVLRATKDARAQEVDSVSS